MSDADRIIRVLHTGYADLAPLVRGLTDEQLTGPSGASAWDVSQVLSHLGSGAEIGLATLRAALSADPPPGSEANREIWARWDAMIPQQRLDGFLAANADLLAGYDALDAATRESLRIDLGYLPAPVDLATAARFRLNEFALHSWDVRVGLDPQATVDAEAAELLQPQVASTLGWLAKPAALLGRSLALRIDLIGSKRSFGLQLGDAAALVEPPGQPDGTLAIPDEAWLRLVSGRLSPEHTPASVRAGGEVSLDLLRRVFPGF